MRADALRALSHRDRVAEEVLDLVHDSLLDDQLVPGPRRVGFGMSRQAVRVEVEAAPERDGPSLTVVCTAPSAKLVEVDVDGSAPTVRAAAPGSWTVESLRHGLVSFVMTVNGRRFRTAWLRF